MHKCSFFIRTLWILILFSAFLSCTAPRGIFNSGKVTAPGHLKVGVNYGGNIATEPLSQLDDVSRAAIDAISKKDTVYYDEQIDVFAKAITAYAIDPVGPNFDLYFRYGIAPRVDAGYRFASGTHVFDVMYQFLGSTGTPTNPGQGKLYGSVGLQFSGQDWDIVDKFYLDKISPLLQFTANRKDLVIPVIFSTSFGPEEETGSFSWGVVYSHTFIEYGFEPGKIYTRYAGQIKKVDPVLEKNNYASYGAFLNLKLGYKYIYVLPALTLYYQNYGTFRLLEGREYSFSGLTIIPSLGVQVNFNTKRNK